MRRYKTTIEEELAKAHAPELTLVFHSKACTRRGVNKAIDTEYDTGMTMYPTEKDFIRDIGQGIITFHKNGFIVWGDDRDYHF